MTRAGKKKETKRPRAAKDLEAATFVRNGVPGHAYLLFYEKIYSSDVVVEVD